MWHSGLRPTQRRLKLDQWLDFRKRISTCAIGFGGKMIWKINSRAAITQSERRDQKTLPGDFGLGKGHWQTSLPQPQSACQKGCAADHLKSQR